MIFRTSLLNEGKIVLSVMFFVLLVSCSNGIEYLESGKQYYNSKDYKLAIKSLSQAINSSDLSQLDLVKAHILISKSYSEMRQFEEAINQISKAIEADNRKVDLYFIRANYLANLKKFGPAKIDLAQALKIKPNHLPSLMLTSEIHLIQQRLEDALESIELLLAIEENNFEAIKHRGVIRYLMYDYELAIKDFSDYLNHFPEDQELYIKRGRSFIEKLDYPNARKDFLQAANLNPISLEAYIYLSVVQLLTGELELALHNINQAIRINSNIGTAHVTKGNILLRMGNLEKATGSFQEAITINPANYEAKFGMGLIEYFNGDLESSYWSIIEAYKVSQMSRSYFSWVIAISHLYPEGNDIVVKRQLLNIDKERWPGILASYMQGIVDFDKVISAASAEEDPYASHIKSAAYFFAGEFNLLNNRFKNAIELYNKCLALNHSEFQVFSLAQIRVKQLEK